jgi:hypothetical protein
MSVYWVERLLLMDIPTIFAETSYHKDYHWVKNYTTILNMPLINQLGSLKKVSSITGRKSIGYIGGVSAVRGSLVTLEALNLIVA